MVYEFVCWSDVESCQQQIEQELLKKCLSFALVQTNLTNQWFQIRIPSIEFSEIKQIESVNRMLLTSRLRLVRPVHEIWAI